MNNEMKIHTRRFRKENAVADSRILQRTINRLRGVGVAPRGIYRFTSHEEAEQWQIRQLARIHALQSSKTS